MIGIRDVLEANIDVVNELINAAFRAGCSTDDMPGAIASEIREFARQAVYARTLAQSGMPVSGRERMI